MEFCGVAVSFGEFGDMYVFRSIEERIANTK